MNAKVKGYILGSIAAASYGMNPLFALPLYKRGMDPDSVLFFRYLFAISILGIFSKAQESEFQAEAARHIAPDCVGMVSGNLFPDLVSKLQLHGSKPSTILFVYPILVAVIMALAFKENHLANRSASFLH